jgi:type II secretory pathway component PulF|tara:strand:+ start:437 stop:664 length:228 start_codon:yes stop_codon:yes gene_type:complete
LHRGNEIQPLTTGVGNLEAVSFISIGSAVSDASRIAKFAAYTLADSQRQIKLITEGIAAIIFIVVAGVIGGRIEL